jgi:hypothetical protein
LIYEGLLSRDTYESGWKLAENKSYRQEVSLLLSRDLMASYDRQNDIVANTDEFIKGLRVCELTYWLPVRLDDHVARLQASCMG